MAKKDAIIGLIIGFLIGVFLFIGLKTLQIHVSGSWLIILLFPPLTLLGLVVAAVIGKKFLAVWQLAKFFLVGALNTLLDLGVLNFLMWSSGVYTGVFFVLFKGTSFLAAATNSYFWNKHWTFERRNGVFTEREYVKFLTIAAVGLLVNVGTAGIVVDVIGPQFGVPEQLWANVGAFIAAFASFIWNFIGSKFMVFKK
ncbi:MAG: family 2 glycosyl transferase [Parcubacteria group bacterium Gr01-1014_30]|nr:MAG: family 2 glycosyl transferase [Parcubacteria group bacterium Gr01-1014_30]